MSANTIRILACTAASIAVLGLVGCSSGESAAPTTSSASTAAAASGSAPGATATAQPTDPSSEPAPEPVAAGLTFGAWGPITLGMTTAEVEAAGFALESGGEGDGCRDYQTTAPDGTQLSLGFTATDPVLSRIRSSTGTAALPDASPTIGQVRAAYPDATVSYAAPMGPNLALVRVEGAGPAIITYSVVTGGSGDDAVVGRPETGPAASTGSTLGCPRP